MENNITERIQKIVNDLYGGVAYNFSTQMGIKESTMRGILQGSDARVSNIVRICECIPNISCEWLIRGRGEMFVNNFPMPNKPSKEVELNEIIKSKDSQIDNLSLEVEALKKQLAEAEVREKDLFNMNKDLQKAFIVLSQK